MSQVYSIMCSCIIFKRIQLKISQQSYVKIGIFPIPLAYSGFSSKIGRIPTRTGWLDSLQPSSSSNFLWIGQSKQCLFVSVALFSIWCFTRLYTCKLSIKIIFKCLMYFFTLYNDFESFLIMLHFGTRVLILFYCICRLLNLWK